jgi:hypothetical protein
MFFETFSQWFAAFFWKIFALLRRVILVYGFESLKKRKYKI